MAPRPDPQCWTDRADAAEAALLARHMHRLWGLPGTRLGVVAWPATRAQRQFVPWDYWWQAHLLDCVVDAADRDITPARRRRIADLGRGLRVRNGGRWTDNYYDDMGWLALALHRAQRHRRSNYQAAVAVLTEAIRSGYNREFSAVRWLVGSDYYNTPANGPAGILFARLGILARSIEIADWIDKTLRDPATGLIADGIHLPRGTVEHQAYTYCQGVTIGLDTELACRTGDPRFAGRAARLIGAVADQLAVDRILIGAGGGDGGLFAGILARYLALAVELLPGDTPDIVCARRYAAEVVLRSAESAWDTRLVVDGHPLFGADWRLPAHMPVISSQTPERDLSVQVSGWMLMEAAYRVAVIG